MSKYSDVVFSMKREPGIWVLCCNKDIGGCRKFPDIGFIPHIPSQSRRFRDAYWTLYPSAKDGVKYSYKDGKFIKK